MTASPRLRRDPSVVADNIARYAFGPLSPGLAGHLGGALRRVMVACLPGPAVVAASVEGAPHEFATLPGVTPDVPRLLNALARVRLTGQAAATGEARLSVSGPAAVRAGDLTLPDGLQVANPDVLLAEVSAGVELKMVATVADGIGFAPRRTAGDGFAVAGAHSPVDRVRIEELGDDVVIEIETAGLPPLDALRDAASLLAAHLQTILPTADSAEVRGPALSERLRQVWAGKLNRLTYAYDAAPKGLAIHGMVPAIAGPVGELLSAAVARRPDPPAIIAEPAVIDSPGVEPRLEVSCATDGEQVDCLSLIRGTAQSLCQLLAGLHQEPTPEPIPLPSTPTMVRSPVEGRVVVEKPDLGFWPDDLLAIPRESFAGLVGPGEGSLAALLAEFFPVESHDGRWRLELLQVRVPGPALAPDEARQERAAYEAPILLRTALRDAQGRLIQEQEVAVGALPLMTENGTFILQGKTHDIAISNELRPAVGLTAYRVEAGAIAHLIPVHGPEILLRLTSDGGRLAVTIDGQGELDLGSVLVAFAATPDEADAVNSQGLGEKQAASLVSEWIASAAVSSPAEARKAVARATAVAGLHDTEAAFEALFRDRRGYDLGERGRQKLHERLGDQAGQGPFLTWRDIAGAALLLCAIVDGRAEGDEPGSLATHVLWPPGRLLAEAVRQGLLAQIPAIAERLSATGGEPPDVQDLLEDLTVGEVVARFFAISPLVQPLDDTNGLSRVEHCRRVRLGVARTAGRSGVPLECRQLAADAPGRLCVLETPEGPNIGLITYLATGARLDEHGFLLAPLRRVENGRVSPEVVWLRAEDEVGVAIAGPHPAGTAIPDPTVACRRNGRLERCSPEQVDFVEAGHGSILGTSASLIPASAHSDPTRLLMGANMQRQAVEVYEPEPPLVRTGAEDRLAREAKAIPLGRNFLVAYLPWSGHNFEDAIVVSEAVVAASWLSSVHRESLSVSLRPDETATCRPAGFAPDRLRALGPEGIARVGAQVRPGDVLVGVERLNGGDGSPRPLVDELSQSESRSLVVPVYASGTVAEVHDLHGPGSGGRAITVDLLAERPLARGDKLSNRHGAKGVIGRIVPVEEMPVLPDGRPVEIVLNPLGVPSRLNLGQLLEASLGWAGATLRSEIIVPPGVGVTRETMAEIMRRAGLPADGKVVLRDGRTGRRFDEPSLVGYLYLHKLDHLAADKIHARATGPYSPVTQQPTGGRAGFGGQRFGEMETWALQGYGAAHTLREVLTIKSDDVRGRAMAYEAILRGESPEAFGPPELLWVLLEELHALGLGAEVKTDDR